MRTSGRGGRALLGATFIVLAACGNTMQDTGQQATSAADPSTLATAGVGAGNDNGAPSGATSSVQPANAARSSAGAASAAAGGGSGAPTGAPGAVGAPGATGTPSITGVRGITDDTIAIGIGTIDVAALTATFAPGSETGSETVTESVQAIVDYMNRNGGILGRQIVAYYHDFPMNELVDASAEQRREQAMCDDFTLDRPTFAAMPLVSAAGIFNNCAAERDLITFDIANLGEYVDSQRFPEISSVWYRPNWITGERREEVVVDQLERRGFFDDDNAKVGVLIYDLDASRRTYERALLPALERRGVKPVETFSYGAFDDGQAAVLRFKAAGITHVIWGGCICGGLTQATFMNAADSQDYHPLYGLSGDLNIGALKGIGASRTQMQSSIAFGFNPSHDGVASDEPLNAKAAKCNQAQEEAGYEGSNYVYCEGFFLLKEGIEAAAEISAAGFRASVEAMGDSYVPVSTFSTRWTSTHHDAISAVRDLFFETECECWKYRGDPQPVG